ANGVPFDQPFFGSWQLAQLTVSSHDSRGSKYSCLPSSTFSGVSGLSAGTGTGFSPSGTLSGSAANATSGSIATANKTKREANQRIAKTSLFVGVRQSGGKNQR